MEEKFLAYETVRRSGLTNMLDLPMVGHLADKMCSVSLTRDDVWDIINNYETYAQEYLPEDQR